MINRTLWFTDRLALLSGLLPIFIGCQAASGMGLGAGLVTDAGLDKVVFPGDLVVLDATANIAVAEGRAVVYWTQILGTPVQLSDPEAPVATFLAPDTEESELLVFELAVDDGVSTEVDEIQVIVEPGALEDSQVEDSQIEDSQIIDDTELASADADWGQYPRVEFYCDTLDGVRDLYTTCTAATVDGAPLPTGEFSWTFDDVLDAGPVNTHSTRTRFFTSGGLHTVRLTLTLAGLAAPLVCLNPESESAAAKISVWPKISGHVRDGEGDGIGGVTVAANQGGQTAVTDAGGFYQVSVPYGWSGSVTPQHVDYVMDPERRALREITSDVADVDFTTRLTTTTGARPVPQPTTVTTLQNTPVVITLRCSAPGEGTQVTFSVVTPPEHGGLGAVTSSGPTSATVRYTPTSGFTGVDAFSFKVNDGTRDSAVATATVTVGSSTTAPSTAPNTAPSATPQTVIVTVGSPRPITLTGSDPDGDSLTFQIESPPAHGALSGSPPNVIYTPFNAFQGADTFQFVVNDGTRDSTAATVTLAVGSWSPPIGIPAPSFGITQTAPASPSPWTGAVPGFYYVDNTHSSATDTDNANGHPLRPRRTIPYSPPLPAGSVVEVRGGPYNYGSSGYIQFTAQGTAQSPVFIRGVGMPRFSQKVSVYAGSATAATYLILEGLDLFRCEIIAPAHHIALRRCNVQGDLTSGGVVVASYSGSYVLSDVLVYDNVIHDNGNWGSSTDQDIHGVAVGARASNVWILDNELYRNSGDGVQINAGSLQDQATTHHIYVGRNRASQNKQTGFWTKQAVDVIFSENTSHNHYPVGATPSAWGAGMGYQYGPERVWFLYNHIYDCAFGIQAMSTSGAGSGQASYFIGNVIHDIHHDRVTNYNPQSAWSNAAMMLMGTANCWVVNNTIYDVDAGINGPGAGMYHLANNIIHNIADPAGNHIFIEQQAAATPSRVLNTIVGGPGRIRWGTSQVYGLAGFQAAFPSNTNACLAADPMLFNPSGGDFHLSAGSPAIDRGMVSAVYATFSGLYGINISVDPERVQRPRGSAIDLGAYERP